MSCDLYKILGLCADADSGEIRVAYRTLAKKYHPDMSHGVAEAEVRIREINQAYEIARAILDE